MSKKIWVVIIIIVSINIVLTLFSLYQQRIIQARTCIAIGAINDNVMTKLNGTVNDKKTVGIFNQCVGHYFFLVPGF